MGRMGFASEWLRYISGLRSLQQVGKPSTKSPAEAGHFY
jgi:hypothetical protein